MRSSGQMPIRYHKDDAKFISDQLARLHPAQRVRACVGYNGAYDEAFSSEIVEHRKSNKARHEANKRLRIYVDNVIKAEANKQQEKIKEMAQDSGFEW